MFIPATRPPANATATGPTTAKRARLSLIDPARVVPSGLTTEEFRLRPILTTDAERDHEAIMETRADLRVWEQSSWPEDDFTVEADREDLADLEQRHPDRRAFTYTVLDPNGTECLGCVYIFPTTASFLAKADVTPVADARSDEARWDEAQWDDAQWDEVQWDEVDAVVYFWVRASRIPSDLDARLLAAVRTWLNEEWDLARTVFVTSERFVRQVELLEGASLRLRFELREPGKPAAYLVYG